MFAIKFWPHGEKFIKIKACKGHGYAKDDAPSSIDEFYANLFLFLHFRENLTKAGYRLLLACKSKPTDLYQMVLLIGLPESSLLNH